MKMGVTIIYVFAVSVSFAFVAALREPLSFSFDPAIGLGFVSLADELEHILGHKVDLVSSRAIRASLWKQIEPDLIVNSSW
jgi:hypothetical protein